ncbi:MAG: hypothetical protein PVH86_07970, partial [Thiogranum sp.]
NQQRVLDSGPCNAYTGEFHKLIEHLTQGFVTPFNSCSRNRCVPGKANNPISCAGFDIVTPILHHDKA